MISDIKEKTYLPNIFTNLIITIHKGHVFLSEFGAGVLHRREIDNDKILFDLEEDDL